MLEFKYDPQKAVHAILWWLHRHGGQMNKLKLVKLIFYADRKHLVQYGRPIIGGHYVAMPFGPVHSEAYDVIKCPRPQLPFRVEGQSVIAQLNWDEEFLSESDIEILNQIDNEYGKYDGISLCDKTHKLQAWKQYYQEGTSTPLPYEAFFLDEQIDPDILAMIQEDQEAWSVLEQ